MKWRRFTTSGSSVRSSPSGGGRESGVRKPLTRGDLGPSESAPPNRDAYFSVTAADGGLASALERLGGDYDAQDDRLPGLSQRDRLHIDDERNRKRVAPRRG